MRKFALLLAAALIVTAPLVAIGTTDTHAAAAKAKKAAKSDKGGKESSGDPNTAFVRALGDLGASLGQPNTGGGEGKGAKAGKSGGKKAAKGGKGGSKKAAKGGKGKSKKA
jgi:hypothetical protein